MAWGLAQMGSLPWVLCVALMAVVVVMVVFRRARRGAGPQIHASIESMRSVGELVVFKIIAKEIATHSEHLFQEFGKKWMTWLISEKKMAMIFEFEIDFRYDLRSSDFEIEADERGRCHLKMPPCFYNVQLRNISFYDEQESRLLPELLPSLVTRIFGGGFTEDDRNRLFEESRRAAEGLAADYVTRMKPEVEQSARETLENMARGLGMTEVTVDFQDLKPVGRRAVLALKHAGQPAAGAEPEPAGG